MNRKNKKNLEKSFIYNVILLAIVLSAGLYCLFSMANAEYSDVPAYQMVFAEEGWLEQGTIHAEQIG